MTIQQAIALHGEVKLIPADMPYYSSVFERLLDNLEERSPMVEGADLGCAYLGLEGLQMIYTSDGALVNTIKEVIPGAFDVRLGIADGKFPVYLNMRGYFY